MRPRPGQGGRFFGIGRILEDSQGEPASESLGLVGEGRPGRFVARLEAGGRLLAPMATVPRGHERVRFGVSRADVRSGELRKSGHSWREEARTQRSSAITDLNVDPRLDGLRADPRFAALVRRAGLP